MKHRFRLVSLLLICLLVITTACNGKPTEENKQPGDHQVIGPAGNKALKIISGSENKELTPVLERFVKETGIGLDIEYKGSLDIMRELSAEQVQYDAVWPASSLWISLGDSHHRVKHLQSTSITPVVFGIKKSLAEKLGFVDKPVKMADILKAIESKQLKFTMTSATQSNSGASAYLAFLHALAGSPDVLTPQHLEDPALQEAITKLLAGVDRSSGSSEWLKTMFLNGDYDAMVNYEALIITTNRELQKQGKELLHLVYPEDGIAISDSPLGYLDRGDAKKEEAFQKFQAFLSKPEIQSQIQTLGRRTGFAGIDQANVKHFPKEWGIDVNKVISPIKTPAAETIQTALDMYQTSFKKPSFNVYVLDYSGSMTGTGNSQLREAMSQLLIQEKAKQNLLQASKNEVNHMVFFDDRILGTTSATGNGAELEALQQAIEKQPLGGATDIYGAAIKAMEILNQSDLSNHSPAIILLTDGMHNGRTSYRDFERAYKNMKQPVPIFAITFGSASESELKQITDLTGARLFDGKSNLIEAFKKVKGYN